MGKSKDTYPKIAETFEEKGEKVWVKVKSADGGYRYEYVSKNYETAEKTNKKEDEI